MNNIIRSGAFKLNGKSYRYTVSWDYDRSTARAGKAFVFGPGDDMEDDALMEVAKEVGSDTIYTSRGVFPKLDKAWDKHNREIVRRKREVLDVAIFLADLKPKNVYFARTAGCGCGCSPGFVLSGLDRRELHVSEVK